MNRNILYVFLSNALLLSACTPTVQVKSSWKNEPQLKQLQTAVYRNIFIVALTDNPSNRRIVEDDLAEVAAAEGYTPIKSVEALATVFTSGKAADQAQILQAAKEMNAHGIFTIALIEKGTETRHTSGSTAYAPFPKYDWYGNFGGYYGHWSGVLYDPGYYAAEKAYYIESNLFDAGSENIVWSGQSEPYNSPTLPAMSKKFAHAIIKQLEKDGLLRR